jgi:hypothetical protein
MMSGILLAGYEETAQLTFASPAERSSDNKRLLCWTKSREQTGTRRLRTTTTALASVQSLVSRLSIGLLAQAGSDDDGSLDGRILAQVEVRRLTMTKSATCPLSAIVGGLPVGMMQELA